MYIYIYNPYAPCIVYLHIFTYIWVIYGGNVGNYPYIEHMGNIHIHIVVSTLPWSIIPFVDILGNDTPEASRSAGEVFQYKSLRWD